MDDNKAKDDLIQQTHSDTYNSKSEEYKKGYNKALEQFITELRDVLFWPQSKIYGIHNSSYKVKKKLLELYNCKCEQAASIKQSSVKANIGKLE